MLFEFKAMGDTKEQNRAPGTGITQKGKYLQPDQLGRLYKTHLQGALVRSGASLFMWLFACITFFYHTIDTNSFIGVSLSVVYIILMNIPTLWVLKHITRRSYYEYFSLFINLLEIIGYTAVIYFIGGIRAWHLTAAYAALIMYVGVVGPRRIPFIVATTCAIVFSLMASLEHSGFLPHQNPVLVYNLRWIDLFLDLLAFSALLYVVAFISAYTSGLLKRTRDKLYKKNMELAHEIEEKRRAEEALKSSEEKFRSLSESSPDIILTLGTDGAITYVNPAWEKILGYKREEVIGRYFLDFSGEENARRYIDYFKRIRDKKEILRDIKITLVHKDGSLRLFIISAAPNMDSTGKVTGVVELLKDITEQEMLQAQLQEAQKMEAIGRLAGGVAHDLNNILSGVVSYPDLLLLDIPETSPLRKPLMTIKHSGQKAAAIVQDLLTLARRGVSIKEPVNLNDIIDEYLESPEHEKLRSYHPNVEVETRLDPDLLNILGSPVHLSKTVMNLVSNAAEALIEGGKITITTENLSVETEPNNGDPKQGDYAVLKVSDTGTGISPKDMEKIFEPFYTKKVMGRSGTGLGLAVVWGTVKDHMGHIDVKSEVGKGTTFTVYFPATRQGSTKDMSWPTIKNSMGKGEKILVVDDVQEQREIASSILRRLNYSVASVSSGEEAVEYMRHNSVDLLLLDMIMDPGIDGLETYKRILGMHPGQKAIIASGFTETERVKEAKRLGAGSFIRKPYLLEKLAVTVRAELDR